MDIAAMPKRRSDKSGLAALSAKADKLIAQAGVELALQAAPRGKPVDIFVDDVRFPVHLPHAAFDVYQRRLAVTRAHPDPLLLRQLFALIPNLRGKTFVDVGAYSGLDALIVRRFLKPARAVLFEPQPFMARAIELTLAENPEGCPVELHRAVIGPDQGRARRSDTKTAKLFETTFDADEAGDVDTVPLDSFEIADVGLLNIDVSSRKLPILQGARDLIETNRPAILVNLVARDIAEFRAYLEPLGYLLCRIGQNSMIYLPEH